MSESSNGTTTPYLWDRLAGLPQLIDDGSQAYLHGAGPLVQIDPAGTRYDLLPDGLNSVRGLADGSGALAGTASFTAFGGWASQSGVSSRFGFTGEYYAATTGLWHLRARDLNPTLGRFLSADSVQPCPKGSHRAPKVTICMPMLPITPLHGSIPPATPPPSVT